MRAATSIKAPDGRHYELEFSTGDNYVTAWIKLNRLPVGYAKLSLRANIANLEDIHISSNAPNSSALLRLFFPKLFTRNFRGKGIGSLFLNAVCDHLRCSGIKRIEGTMSGDIDRLARWYGKAGFEVDQVSKSIGKELVVHN